VESEEEKEELNNVTEGKGNVTWVPPFCFFIAGGVE
jgi:hypothetical protein